MEMTHKLRQQLTADAYQDTFTWLYPDAPAACRRRYTDAVDTFVGLYGDRPATLVSAPGRTEVSGNHVDHQRGIVLAASVNLDLIGVVAPNEENIIRIQSQGYPADVVNVSDLSPRHEEAGTAAALIRGVAAWFHQNGFPIGGFDAYTTSDVLGGSGLSSSAAFEVAIGRMLCTLYGGGITPPQIAMAGQYAENHYFGKPCGLMDQMACSVGNFTRIDLADPQRPLIQEIPFELEDCGLHLCIVDTKGSHADLTGDYAAVPAEMGAVAALLGKDVLREVDEADFFTRIGMLRAAAGDRAVLRAMHFFQENKLVPQVAAALETGDISRFLDLVTQSGRSSFCCLQNVFATSRPDQQGLSLALALSEQVLAGNGGAWRVHGGGFAGTIQAFVPDVLLNRYRDVMNGAFGSGACHVLRVRPTGSAEITPELWKGAAGNGRASV